MSFDIFRTVVRPFSKYPPGSARVGWQKEFNQAMGIALELALKRYNTVRDQLSTWPNSSKLVTLTYATEGTGFVLTYIDNPSMTTAATTEIYAVETHD